MATRILCLAGLIVAAVLALRTGKSDSGDGSVGNDGPPDPDKLEMLVRLHEENARLQGQVSNLAGQVMSLEVKLAEARAQADVDLVMDPAGKVPSVSRLPAEVLADPARVQIVDVNREMMVAVVSGGARAGMKTGMLFSVVRDDRVLAVIRVSEVRERVAGGLIEWSDKNAFPEAGDRLVLRSTQDG